jgi:hypothetical protein
VERPLAIHQINLFNQIPGLATECAGVHGESATHGTRNTGQKFSPRPPVPSGKPRESRAGNAGLSHQTSLPEVFHCPKSSMNRDNCAIEATISNQQITAETKPKNRYLRIQALQKRSQVVEILRLKKIAGRTAHFPTGMFRHGLLTSDGASNSYKFRLLACGHCRTHP